MSYLYPPPYNFPFRRSPEAELDPQGYYGTSVGSQPDSETSASTYDSGYWSSSSSKAASTVPGPGTYRSIDDQLMGLRITSEPQPPFYARHDQPVGGAYYDYNRGYNDRAVYPPLGAMPHPDLDLDDELDDAWDEAEATITAADWTFTVPGTCSLVKDAIEELRNSECINVPKQRPATVIRGPQKSASSRSSGSTASSIWSFPSGSTGKQRAPTGRYYSCPTCGRERSRKEDLRDHQRKHGH